MEVIVAVDPQTAFAVFTEETDLWWRNGFQYRVSGRNPGTLLFESGLGGRLFESFETTSGPRVVVMGKITAWEPPSRLEFEWRAANFSENECTQVEVLFTPVGKGTRVTVRHRGWSGIRAGHPARHGLEGADFIRMIGLWWGGLMTSYRERLSR